MSPKSSIIVRASLIAAATLGAASGTAWAQTVTYTLNPAYKEGENGANGWYRVNVGASYECEPGEGDVQVSCPGRDTFRNGAGVPDPIVRTGLFLLAGPVAVTLESAPGVPLRIDSGDPPAPTVTVPSDDGGTPTFDAGSVVRAEYACAFAGDLSGPSPQTPCVGTVPVGEPINTGDPARPGTWRQYQFQVVAMDAAGNSSAPRRVRYNIDELPGAPVPVSPASGQAVPLRPVLGWSAPSDLGSGFSAYRVRITTGGRTREYETGQAGQTVTFTVPEDLPLGAASWTVTFVDRRGRTAVSEAHAMTVVSRPPPEAPRLTASPVTTVESRPLFAWEPAETGGSFAWEVSSVGRVVQSGTTTAVTVRPEPLAPGVYGFRVRQVSDLGGAGPWSAPTGFTVVEPPVTAPPPASVSGPPQAPAATPSSPAPRITVLVPATRNAAMLRPRAGARVAAKPTITWRRTRGATVYNLQVFRLVNRRPVKVLSVFPRANRYRVTKGLVPGARYVWRVWPYIGRTKRFAKQPSGISWFDVRR